ncbi:MAG TPA: extracellular solute-binding protein [Longimicrobiales bacterium]
MKRNLIFALATLALGACAPEDDRTPLVVYSPHGRDLLVAFEQAFEAARPEVDVQWLDMGSQEVIDRLRSEQANPQADVWFGAPSSMFEQGASEGLLEAYRPAWADAVPADAHGSGDTWFGIYLTPEVIAYNSQVVDSAEAPQDWDDVLDPTWRDRVLIRDPVASGTMRAIFGMILQRSLRETGDVDAGFDWLRRLDANTREYTLNPTLLYQKLARQEGVVTLWDLPDIEMLIADGTMPIDYVIPQSGTPVVVDGIAVVRGTPHPDAARAFVDFVGDVSGLTLAAREHFRIPARSDFPADSLPQSLRDARALIRPEPMDWAMLEERGTEWMRRWDEEVRGRGGQPR